MKCAKNNVTDPSKLCTNISEVCCRIQLNPRFNMGPGGWKNNLFDYLTVETCLHAWCVGGDGCYLHVPLSDCCTNVWWLQLLDLGSWLLIVYHLYIVMVKWNVETVLLLFLLKCFDLHIVFVCSDKKTLFIIWLPTISINKHAESNYP